VVAQIRQQQMKRKKRRGQKEIVHRMQINPAQRGQDKNQEEKEK